MTAAIQIRELTRDDAAAYTAVRLRMLREHPEAFTSSFEEESRSPLAWVERRIAPGGETPYDFLLGAFSDANALIGTVGFSVEMRIKQRHKGLLFGMYVAPEAATQGVGRALLAACVDRARCIPQVEQINLTVTATNERARRLYEAAGFRTFGVEERAIRVGGAYHSKAHMVLYLSRQIEPRSLRGATMNAASGRCLCGAVSFSVGFPTKWVAHCHCTLCQRAHGAAFVTWVSCQAHLFELDDAAQALHWHRSSANAERGFCSRCGSSLFFRSENWPGEVHVARANFTSKPDREPQVHSHYDTHAGWFEVNDGLPKKPAPGA